MSSGVWRLSIELLAGDRQWSDTRESMLNRAARKAGVSFRAIKSLYYGESLDPKYSVGAAIRRAAMQQAARLEAIADSLEATDAESYRETIDRYRILARQVRGEAS